MKEKVLITGGNGFLGAALAIGLVHRGYQVRVFDNNSRGHPRRLESVHYDIEFVEGDIRDQEAVYRATSGMDWVFHLAFVNGTRHFYEQPGLVLDVGVRGALTTMDAVKKYGIQRYIVASSSEVYQEPSHVPTKENERIIIPDVSNPRFSYSGGKIITELLTLHYLTEKDAKRIIFRPHNVYGPDMGWEHVVPEFMRRVREGLHQAVDGRLKFPIQGSGKETRAFCYIDDAVEGIIIAAEGGDDANIYHLGVDEEVEITDVAERIGRIAGVKLDLVTQELLSGGTSRRSPDITKLRSLGYQPKVSLDEGLRHCWAWYAKAPLNI
ncbi:MAG: NAD-dependent dehydratase [Candidatus Margulisbacteria bacterium GWF2_35_9]|nr:MAG: NAD-dependent dehydratase [Candidatus Margulisbacteria bacterium GWF2_35_9]